MDGKKARRSGLDVQAAFACLPTWTLESLESLELARVSARVSASQRRLLPALARVSAGRAPSVSRPARWWQQAR